MNKKARIAVIGTGWWATEAHIPALLANADADLVALCDTSASRVGRPIEIKDLYEEKTNEDH